MVRPLIVIATVAALTSLSAAEGIRVHVSPRDLEAIRATVGAASREPVLYIDAVIEPKRVAGSIPVQRFVSRPRGNGDVRFESVTLYERTDQVTVLTGTKRAVSGGSFLLRKSGSRWKIVSHGTWLH
jgi:hypothetical protein